MLWRSVVGKCCKGALWRGGLHKCCEAVLWRSVVVKSCGRRMLERSIVEKYCARKNALKYEIYSRAILGDYMHIQVRGFHF